MQAEQTDFVEMMETMFGSDEVLGVYFEREDDGSTLTLAQYSSLYALLGDDMPSTISLLPHGGSAICCTDYATFIYLTLPGRVQVFGFPNEDNPTSKIVQDAMHPGGHDYAVVDGRYIVDPWPRLVHGGFTQMVFDLEGEGAGLALEVYGPRTCWTHNEVAEQDALERQAPVLAASLSI
jgi:hypothetical protein